MVKPIAIYFPQFYPTEINDRVWGKGFTDWALVANANLRSLWQRRSPQAGFYDGAAELVHKQQMSVAHDNNLGGFAVYHYWFYNSHELPAFESSLIKLTASDPTSWFLIWASEPWTRRWLGDPSVIMGLTDDPDQYMIERHADYVCQCFAHPRYLRWRGNPVFIWYNIGYFKYPEKIADVYRRAFQKRGFAASLGHFVKNPFEAVYSHFMDITYAFEPRLFFGFTRTGRGTMSKKIRDQLTTILGDGFVGRLLTTADRFQQKGKTYKALEFIGYMNSLERKRLLSTMQTTNQNVISPGWNNVPRYGKSFTALESLSSAEFHGLLTQSIDSDLPILINAWNEWSEGAAIEPCEYLGTRYLDVIANIASAISGAL